jgi:hypothetical protein
MNENAETPLTLMPEQDQATPVATSGRPRKWASCLLLALIVLTGAFAWLFWGIDSMFYGPGAKGPSALADAHTRDLAVGLAAAIGVASVALFAGLRKYRSRAVVLAVIVPMQVGALGWLMSAFG